LEIRENLSLDNLDGEIWKEIEGYSGDYYVSNYGRIKSFKNNCGISERILIQNKDKGYFCVGLCKNGKPKTKRIHTLMYETFINKIPKGYVVHHTDFTKNDFLENFEMMTNEEHRRLHTKGENNPNYGKYGKENPNYGEHPSEETKKLMSENNKGENNPMFGSKRPGEKSGHHTLTEQDVIQIRRLCDEGILTQREIGEKFGVSQVTISDIKRGKIWRHLNVE